MTAESDAGRLRSPFAMLPEGFLSTVLATPPALRVAIGSVSLDLHSVEPTIPRLAAPVLDHARSTGTRAQHIRVAVVDTFACGLPAPPPVAGTEALRAPFDEVNLRDGAAIVTVHQAESLTYETFDAANSIGLILTSDARRIAPWEWASPFKRIVAWATPGKPYGLLHGAVLARDGEGVMLAGGSGVGKSTTTAAAILGGIESAGDDVIFAEWLGEGEVVANAVYDSLKVGVHALEFLGERIEANGQPVGPSIPKHLLRLSDVAPGRLVQTVRLRAILIPRIANAERTTCRRVGSAAALRALGPASAYVMRVTPDASFALASRIARSLPAFAFDLSTSPHEIVGTLDRLLAEISAGRWP